MTDLLIEIYKHRIELIKDVYLINWDFIKNIELDLSTDGISDMIPQQSDYDRYFFLEKNKIENDEFTILKKKLTNWKILLNYIPDHDKNSLGDLIKKVYDLEKKKIRETVAKKKSYYLFFDTETTGLPNNWKAPLSDFKNWPRLVQLAYMLYDEEGILIEEDNFIIMPEGFTIPFEASKIHGITTDTAISKGVNIEDVLNKFQDLVEKSEYLVAHNISFDEKIMGAEYLRNGFQNLIDSKKKICTMERTTNYCKLQGPYGYKWPKLSELHYKLFGYNFEEAHDASVDIKATAKCFWELKKNNFI